MPSFAERLQTIFQTREGMNASRLASLTGISKQSVYDWLEGAQPRIDNIETVAQALSVDPCWLAFGADPKPREQINIDVLRRIISGAEAELLKHKATLPPGKKAQLFAMAYERFMREGGRIDTAALADLVSLAK